MAYPLPVRPEPILTPAVKPVTVRVRISDQPASVHDSYLGGTAVAWRMIYADTREFVWWSPDALPQLVDAAGSVAVVVAESGVAESFRLQSFSSAFSGAFNVEEVE